MAKKSAGADLTTSEAPETAVPFFPGLELVTVLLDGPWGVDGPYLVPSPIPQTLELGTVRYDLSDRAVGRYTWRHP